jgi:hypothetical protein
MANNANGHPTRLDFLIDGVKQDTLVWDGTSQWVGSTYYVFPSGGAGQGWVVSHNLGTSVNPPTLADSTSAYAYPSTPITGTTSSIRADGKVGYKPIGSGTTSNWYEIVAEGDSSSADSSGNPLSGGVGGAGDPHITPIFGEKYDL